MAEATNVDLAPWQRATPLPETKGKGATGLTTMHGAFTCRLGPSGTEVPLHLWLRPSRADNYSAHLSSGVAPGSRCEEIFADKNIEPMTASLQGRQLTIGEYLYEIPENWAAEAAPAAPPPVPGADPANRGRETRRIIYLLAGMVLVISLVALSEIIRTYQLPPKA